MLSRLSILAILAKIILVSSFDNVESDMENSFSYYSESSSSSSSSSHSSSFQESSNLYGPDCDDDINNEQPSPTLPPEVSSCGPNEIEDGCINGGCGRRNCSQLNKPQLCIDVIPEYCIKGCRCKENYLRDCDGICIPITQCPTPDCGKNKVFDFCPAYCLPDCDVDESLILCKESPKLGDPECSPSCRCADNLYKTKNGSCVPKAQCKKPAPVCSKNEIEDGCINGGCGRRTCSDLNSPIKCVKIAADKCKKGCRCKENYLKDKNGVCIPVTQCPKPECGQNKVFDFCPAVCLPKCDADQSLMPCQEPNVGELECNPSCRCADNFYRTKDGECVPKEKCSTCGKHEVFDECPDPCPRRRCDVDERLIKCRSPPKVGDPECQPGCRCAENYYRTKDGKCVLKSQCPKCTGKDEVYDECPNTCPPQTCESLWKKYHCPIQPAVCRPSCRCKANFYRNYLGECIAKEDCLKCKRPQEYFSCGGACDNECYNISAQNQTNCPIQNIVCNKKCYCKPGYARNVDGECIPISKCPPECKENEKYVKNTNEICKAETCADLGNNLDCFQEGYDNSGEPGCVCIDGYIRNEDGVCIPIENCPSCGGDSNATSGCGTFCTTCSNYEKQDQIACILSCQLNGCACRKSYVYDESIKKCVLPENCPPKCKINEEYHNNTNAVCRPQKCSDLGFPLACLQPGCDSSDGKPGCLCKAGYVRNKKGACIQAKECPSCGGDRNATTGCGVFCKTCTSNRKGPLICPRICKLNGCECKENYIYDSKIKKCVLPQHCQ